MTKKVNAIDIIYIKRVYGSSCGPHGPLSRVLYYRNTHPNLTIKITVDHHWEYEGRIHHETQYYTLSPNPVHDYYTPNHLDHEMGCMVPGPTLQQFHWDLKDAVEV